MPVRRFQPPAAHIPIPAPGMDLDGRTAVTVSCDSLDILALESWRRDSVIHGLEQLLRSLDAELHMLVRVRPLLPEAAGFGGAEADPRSRAVNAFWSHRLREGLVFTRHVTVTSVGRADAAKRQAGRVIELLSGADTTCTESGAEVLGQMNAELCGTTTLTVAAHEAASELVVGGLHLRALELHRFPGVSVAPGWLAPLLRVAACCDIGISVIPEATAPTMRRLSGRMRALTAQRLLEAERGVIPDAAVSVGFQAASQLRDRLASRAGRPLSISVSAVARGTSSIDAHRTATVVATQMATTLAQVRPADLDHAATILRTWGWQGSAGRGKLVDSQAAATCAPWLTASLDDGNGYVIGSTSADGLPVRLDPFDERHHCNANVGIFAASGQGKSFLIGGLVVEARRQGTEVLIVDPEGEYRGVVERLGGRFVDLVADAPINPFELGETAGERVDAVVDVCSELCGGLTDVERAVIDDAARATLDRLPRPLLRDCLPVLEATAPSIAAVLRRHLIGPLGGLLDQPTSAVWTEPLLAIGHQEIRTELLPVTTHLLGRQIWGLVRGRPTRRHVILDEVGMLAAHPPMRHLLALLARRCRKYGSSLVVATQNVQDLLRTDEGQVVAGNCAITFLGGHRAHEAQLMERTFGLTPEQRRHVERCSRGEFVLLAGQRRASMRVELPSEYAGMINPLRQMAVQT